MPLKKIVIFGKGEAGKSTFISTIIPDAINVNHRGRTIALDFGTYRHNGREFHFYGTPGQARFNCIRDILALNAHHALMVFDASRPLEITDSDILREIEGLSLPFFAILNLKRGHKSPLSESDVSGICQDVPGYRGLFCGDVKDQGFVISVLNAL